MIKGKVLCVSIGRILLAKGYKLFNAKEFLLGIWDKYSFFSFFSITRRMFRAEITGAYELADNSNLLVLKKKICKIYHCRVISTFYLKRGSKPLYLCILPNGHVFWGEYFQNTTKSLVNVYGSVDRGKTWNILYTFKTGNINHIHGLFYDMYTDRMWFLTGDRENECIIGYTEDEFKSIHEVFRGSQEYRSCQLFFYENFIVYATDSQYMQNEIRKIDRKTLEITSLAKIQGSAIKGGQTGDVSYLSTTIEPSKVNRDRFSHIWVTKDGEHWEDVFKAEKDCWPAIFQFGTFEFPQNAYCDGKLWFSGRALKEFDGKSSYIEI